MGENGIFHDTFVEKIKDISTMQEPSTADKHLYSYSTQCILYEESSFRALDIPRIGAHIFFSGSCKSKQGDNYIKTFSAAIQLAKLS